MTDPVRIYFLVFGIITIAGGVIGYIKAGSVVSVVAGAITGILLVVAAFIIPMHRELGLGLAILVSAVLAGQFIPRVFRTRRLVPAGIMSVLSVIGIIVAIAAWLGR
jgi:uncharacterized membrane protein (UPF0136 family)